MDLKEEIKDFFKDPFSNQFSYIIKQIDSLHDRITDLDTRVSAMADKQDEILAALKDTKKQ
ncbi:MAG: hypothetical protein H0X33_10005 [Taibaiella sp.]|nr:hypothetical protein [Taibaiella sp.]